MKNKPTLLLATLALLAAWQPAQAVKLTVAMAGTNDELNTLRTNIASFHTVSEHRVDIVALPDSNPSAMAEFSSWLEAELSEVDVYLLDFYQAQQLSQHLVELTYPSASAHWPVVMSAHRIDDKVYALPYYLDVQVLYYRSDWLTLPPDSWQQMQTNSEQILLSQRSFSNSDLEAYAFAADTDIDLAANALEWSQAYGGSAFIGADANIIGQSPENILAFNSAQSWIGSMVPDYLLEINFASMRDRMANGGLIFLRDWFSRRGDYGNTLLGGRVDWAPLPAGDQGSAASVSGKSLAVAKYSANQSAAAQFISFLSSSNVQKTNFLRQGRLPSWRALYADPEVTQVLADGARLAEVLASGSISWPGEIFAERYPEAMRSIATSTRNILNQQASAQGALSGLRVSLEQLLIEPEAVE